MKTRKSTNEVDLDYGEPPPPGASDKKYDAEAKKAFSAISERVKKAAS